jgi:hypothetical protein
MVGILGGLKTILRGVYDYRNYFIRYRNGDPDYRGVCVLEWLGLNKTLTNNLSFAIID